MTCPYMSQITTLHTSWTPLPDVQVAALHGRLPTQQQDVCRKSVRGHLQCLQASRGPRLQDGRRQQVQTGGITVSPKRVFGQNFLTGTPRQCSSCKSRWDWQSS